MDYLPKVQMDFIPSDNESDVERMLKRNGRMKIKFHLFGRRRFRERR
jgi:hypothetical protein